MSGRQAVLVLAAASILIAAGGPVDRRGAMAAVTPRVQTMIVGASGQVLWSGQSVVAGAARLRVGRRTCSIAAATPLATLIAARRAGGPSFSVRDYGRCSGSAANSGQLFVYALGGERNRGQNGWEYKVDGVAGSTGAADTSGPTGSGRRIGSGAQVLWFWCWAAGAGCQRTLEARPSTVAPARGAALSVKVLGRDNEGRAVPVAGAIVKLGSDFASTGAAGSATLIAPIAPGRYQLTSTRPGLVPAFAETIVVK